MTFDWRHPSMKYYLFCKTIYNKGIKDIICMRAISDGRLPTIEDKFQWKTTFDVRWPSIKTDLWWKPTFDGGQHWWKDNLWLNMSIDKDGLWRNISFDWKYDSLWWKMPTNGRLTQMKDNIWSNSRNRNLSIIMLSNEGHKTKKSLTQKTPVKP